MKIFKLLTKIIVLFLFLLYFYYILDYGLNFDVENKFIKPILLSIATLTMIYKPALRILFLILGFVMLGLMVIFYLFISIESAGVMGGFGFSILVILVCLYIPQLIKYGYVKDF